MGEASDRKHIVGVATTVDPFAAFPMPLREVSTKRSMSVISSFDEFDRYPDHRPLTPDEKFDHDYGGDLDSTNNDDMFREDTTPPSNDETRGLLNNIGNSGAATRKYNNYSSTGNDMV